MRSESPKLLEDIRSAAAFVGELVSGKTLADYQADRIVRAAMERQFEIIGEAIKRLANADPETAARISDYPQIIAFRNILIHGYDLVNHQLVWATASHQAPQLLAEVEGILKEVDY